MKPVCEHIRLQGLGAEKQLSSLQIMGYTLYDVRRVDIRTVEFGYAKKDSDVIRAHLTDRGFVCTLLPPRNTAKRLADFKALYPLTIFSLCMLILLSFSMQFIWHVDINSAGAYIGEVRSFLKEEDVHAGCLRENIDLKSLTEKLTQRLPRVAWVHAGFKGLTLSIDVIQGVPMPQIETAGSNGNIIAAQDGVIESVHVYAGTAAVSPGDTVKAGDILIYGHERSSNETLISVRARGKVMARTFIKASASVDTAAFQTHRTSNSVQQVYIHFPGFSFTPNSAPNYLTSEFESVYSSFGGAWLPVQIEKRTIYETYFESISPDENALKAECARLSAQNLTLFLAENDEIIDKWLDYSMIEGGIILATATAEVRRDIARFSPETPD